MKNKKTNSHIIMVISVITILLGIGIWLAIKGWKLLEQNQEFDDNKLFFLIIISIFFLGIATRMYRDWKRIRNFINIKKALQEEKFSFINEKIKSIQNNSEMRKSWESYIDTLYTNKEGKRFQTFDAEYFFNFDFLYKEKIRYKLYSHLPQAILGMGMLGTFYGLSMGLSKLDLGNMDGIQNSVGSLLNGVKTAFYTSLFGLSYSILFSIFNNGYFSEIEKIISDIKNDINELFPKLVKETVMDEIIENLQGIKESNNDMATTLGNQIGEMSKNLNENISNFSNSIGSNFKEEMSGAMEKVFTQDLIDKIGESLSQFTDMFSINSQKMKEFKGEVIQSIQELTDLKNSYGEILGETSKLKDDFRETLENINLKISKTFSEIDLISNKYENTSLIIGKVLENISSAQEENKEILLKNSEIMNVTGELLKGTKEILDAEKSVKELWESYEETFKDINKNLSENMNDYSENLQLTATKFRDIIKESSDQYNTVIKNQTSDYTAEIKKGLQNLFLDYDENLASAVGKFNGVLLGFKDNMDSFSEIIGETKEIFEKNIESIERVKINEAQEIKAKE